jgi:hypothetical protein
MNIFFDAKYYLQSNPDVLQAITMGLIPDAKFHFDNFGWKEGRDPNATFDVSYYLEENPDVLAAGVNPLDHFIQFGAAEGRLPNADFVSFEDFDTDAYAAANPDLEAAGLTTPAQLYAHFATYGFGEDRPGTQTTDGTPIVDGLPGGLAGDDFTLTAGLDEIVGTGGNDTFQGIVGHLDRFDDLDGGAGNDVLNLFIEGAEANDAVSSLADVRDIETINFIYTGEDEGATINAAGFEGATQIWQIDDIAGEDASANDVTGLGADQTVGFRGVIVAETTVTAADDVTSATVALDGAKGYMGGVGLGFEGADIETVSISGDIDGKSAELYLNLGGDAADGITTVNLALTSDVFIVPNSTWNDVVTVDASGSTGDITAAISGTDAFEAITGGSGDDVFAITGAFSADEFTVDGGAGDDIIAFDTVDADTAITVTLGAGADRFEFAVFEEGQGNVTGAADDADLEASLISITDFSVAQDDVIALVDGFASFFPTQAEVNAAVNGLASDATLFDAFEAANAENIGDDSAEYVQFVFDGNLYIANDDTLVELQGVSSVLTAGNVSGDYLAENSFV